MEETVLKRKFIFIKDGVNKDLPDPNPIWTPQKVKSHYAQMYPEILNSNVSGPTISNEFLTYEFSSAIGTKG
jgi:PRTRC genetic system protein C